MSFLLWGAVQMSNFLLRISQWICYWNSGLTSVETVHLCEALLLQLAVSDVDVASDGPVTDEIRDVRPDSDSDSKGDRQRPQLAHSHRNADREVNETNITQTDHKTTAEFNFILILDILIFIYRHIDVNSRRALLFPKISKTMMESSP